MLTDEDAIRKLDLMPTPATLVTQLARRKEAIDFHDLTTTMGHLAFEESQELAQSCIREGQRQLPVLNQSLHMQGLDAHHTGGGGNFGGQLVQKIVSDARNAVMQASQLLFCFAPAG